MENDPDDLDLLFSVDEETLGKVIIKSEKSTSYLIMIYFTFNNLLSVIIG